MEFMNLLYTHLFKPKHLNSVTRETPSIWSTSLGQSDRKTQAGMLVSMMYPFLQTQGPPQTFRGS